MNKPTLKTAKFVLVDLLKLTTDFWNGKQFDAVFRRTAISKTD